LVLVLLEFLIINVSCIIIPAGWNITHTNHQQYFYVFGLSIELPEIVAGVYAQTSFINGLLSVEPQWLLTARTEVCLTSFKIIV